MILKERSSELLLRLQNEYLARGIEANMTKNIPKNYIDTQD